MSALSFLYSQLFVEPPVPTHDFRGQTVIITGANRGIGYEAAPHLLRLNVSRLVLAVRSVAKGQEAAAALEQSTGRPGTVQVEELDMASHDSVKRFATRMESLERLDAVLLNAGIYTQEFVLVDGHESTMAVNVINAFLLALLLLPTLRRSADAWKTRPRLSFVASDRHWMTNLPEWRTDHPFQTLDDPQHARMFLRYPAAKLIQILLVRELARRISDKSPGASCITINSLTPGYCRSGLAENIHGVSALALWVLAKLTARTTEVGGRTLVAAISRGEESHGKYMNDGRVDESALSPFVRSADGERAQVKLWGELMQILEAKQPGISLLV